MTDVRLGRIPSPPDDRDYELARLLAPAPLPASYGGARPRILDQGMTPDCVGFSGAALRSAEERRDESRTLIFDGADLYAGAKTLDGYAGDGTDIRSAAQYLVTTGALVKTSSAKAEAGQRRKIAAYARLRSVDEIKRAIVGFGGAWIGASWYESWFDPNADGTLPTRDKVAGGHAFTLLGWNDTRGAFHGQNSWGADWGLGGRFWLPYAFVDFADMDAWSATDVLGDR